MWQSRTHETLTRPRRRFGFWRGSVEDAVYGFLDCGIFDRGFARVSCTDCRAEYLVAFSCQRRGSARRASPSGARSPVPS